MVTFALLLGALLSSCGSSQAQQEQSSSSRSAGPEHVMLHAAALVVPGLAASTRVWLSCASRTFCALISEKAQYWTWDGTAWAAAAQLPVTPSAGDAGQVSCSSASFCLASFGSATMRYDGRHWQVTRAGSWSPGGGVAVLSCAGPRWCVAGPSGSAATAVSTWDGTSWMTSALTLAGLPTAIGCAHDGVTCGIAAGKDVYVHSVSGWHDEPMSTPLAVSCASAVFCMAGAGGKAERYDGSSWSLTDGELIGALSCSSASFCLGISGSDYLVWTGRSWARGDALPASTDYVFQTAGAQATCPADGWCMLAADSAVSVLTR